MKDINYVKESLIEMLEDLDDRLSTIADEAKQSNNKARNRGEQYFTGSENNEKRTFFEKTAGIEMEKIQQTLSTMDAETYAICLRCGNPLKKSRLKETAMAGLCLDCNKQSND